MASSEKAGDYILNRDYKALIRLNYQHWLVKELFGYLIHPAISIEGKDFRIADIGSGTCIWPVEVSQSLSGSVNIDAFDISAAQFPPKGWLPSNLKLHIHDCSRHFPKNLLGQYDLVQIRFFITIIKDGDPSWLLENIMTLLKPGGYLQWVEGDPTSSRVVTVAETTTKDATEAMLKFQKQPRQVANFSWIPDLASIFASKGLEKIAFERHPIKPVYRSFWNQSHLLLYEEFCSRMNVTDAAEHRQLIPLLHDEFQDGVAIHADFVCCIGRKPVAQPS